jgi:hypothetical protein
MPVVPSEPRTGRARCRLRGAGEDARLDQLRRERGEVRAGVGLRRDGPDGALVAAAIARIDERDGGPGATRCAFAEAIGGLPKSRTRSVPSERVVAAWISATPPGSRRRRRSTAAPSTAGTGTRAPSSAGPSRSRHRVRLRPDDVRAQIPAVGAEGERDHPRDADQVLRLQPIGRCAVPRSPSSVRRSSSPLVSDPLTSRLVRSAAPCVA